MKILPLRLQDEESFTRERKINKVLCRPYIYVMKQFISYSNYLLNRGWTILFLMYLSKQQYCWFTSYEFKLVLFFSILRYGYEHLHKYLAMVTNAMPSDVSCERGENEYHYRSRAEIFIVNTVLFLFRRSVVFFFRFHVVLRVTSVLSVRKSQTATMLLFQSQPPAAPFSLPIRSRPAVCGKSTP